jgi:hypothetical protein
MFLAASTPTHVFAQGSTVNKLTFLTFSGAVQVPGATLPAGRYAFRLADPDTQKIWQVLDAKQRHIIATFFYVPTPDRTIEEMNAADGKPVVIFTETRQGVPPAIHVMYYPTDLSGSEFLYPKEQAKQLAAATHQPVLATDTDAAEGGEARVVLVIPADTAALTSDQQAAQVASEESRPVGTSGSELEKPVGTAGENESAELPTTASP